MNLLTVTGICFIAFAMWGLLRPQRKHKNFSMKDQREAAHRALSNSPQQPGHGYAHLCFLKVFVG